MKKNLMRFWLICIAFTLVFAAVGVQMVRIQRIPGAQEILNQSQYYQGVTQTIYPERGNIYDNHGSLLAGNETIYEVGIDLASVSQPETVAAVAASVLGMDYLEVLTYAQMTPGGDNPVYVTLNGFVSKEKVAQLEIIRDEYANRVLKNGETRPHLDGLMWTPHDKRSYPEGTLAANVLGFYGFLDRTQGVGYYGVEETYNTLLAGTPKKVYTAYDPQKISDLEEIPPGASLILTIDREIQVMTEQVLDDALHDTGAESGVIVISNPKDGSIIAMANTPRLDPNEYWKYLDTFTSSTPFNRAVSETYEPGSVFKVITLAAALDAGAIKPETVFDDQGVILVGGSPVYNWDRGAWGEQDMTGCMQHSLNVCLAWMATQLGPDRFYSYLRAFGFDRITGVDLGSESNWPLAMPGDPDWWEANLGTNAFGQGISVTPIQMVMATGALANEGKMMAPHVVKGMIIDGKQYDVKPVVVGNPVSRETANTVTSMLTNSLVEEASTALVDGYTVAGKTGTAEIPTPYGYTSGETNASFVGWGPSDDPEFLVYIWLEKPTSSIWASEVVSPIFSKLVSKLVILMEIPPDAVRLNAVDPAEMAEN
nr:penicillin-binding protein [uncultured bacterium]